MYGRHFEALKCPMCGGPVKLRARECDYCGSTLLAVSIEFVSGEYRNEIVDKNVDKWKTILKSDPYDSSANYALGLYYLNRKLRDIAVSYLRKATNADPEVPEYHYNLGIALFNDGKILFDGEDYKKAQSEMDYALSLNPDFKEAEGFKHFFIGRKIFEVDKKESIIEYRKAMDSCSNISVFYNNIGCSYNYSNEYEKAEKMLNKALSIDPNMYSAYITLCDVYNKKKDYEKAIEYGEKSVSLLKSSTLPFDQAQAYCNYGFAIWKFGDKKKAASFMKKAIANDPKNEVYKNLLSQIEKKGPCFIATAAYGTPYSPEIEYLRTWRDRSLLKNTFGRSFVRSYYFLSPSIASIIERSELLRSITRKLLIPIIIVLRLKYRQMH